MRLNDKNSPSTPEARKANEKSGGDVNIAFAIVIYFRIFCVFCQGKYEQEMSRIFKIEQD